MVIFHSFLYVYQAGYLSRTRPVSVKKSVSDVWQDLGSTSSWSNPAVAATTPCLMVYTIPHKNGDDWGMGWCKWHCFNHMSRSAMISQMISQMISPHVSSCFIMFHHLSSCLHHVSGWSTWIHGSQKCHQGEAFRLSGGTLASSVKTRRTALFPSHSPACHCPNQTISPGLNQCHPVPTSDFKLGLHHYFMEKITVVHMSHHFSHELCERLPPPLPTVVRFLRQGEALVSRKRLADKPSVGAWADCCWWGNHAEIPWSKHTLLLPGTQNISNFPCKNNKLLPKMG